MSLHSFRMSDAHKNENLKDFNNLNYQKILTQNKIQEKRFELKNDCQINF